jgi:hypothetical protein
MADFKVERLDPQVLAWGEMFLVCWHFPIHGDNGYLVEARLPGDLGVESKVEITKILNERLKALFGTEKVVVVGVEEGLKAEEVARRLAKYKPVETLSAFVN